jgi:hypothetical protein
MLISPSFTVLSDGPTLFLFVFEDCRPIYSADFVRPTGVLAERVQALQARQVTAETLKEWGDCHKSPSGNWELASGLYLPCGQLVTVANSALGFFPERFTSSASAEFGHLIGQNATQAA